MWNTGALSGLDNAGKSDKTSSVESAENIAESPAPSARYVIRHLIDWKDDFVKNPRPDKKTRLKLIETFAKEI